MGIFDGITNWIADRIDEAVKARMVGIETNREYRAGRQARQLRTAPGQPNDNLTVNFTGLVVDRSVSMLFGKGIEFSLPDNEGPQKEYLDAVWDANKQEQMLHRMAVLGAEAGTVYVKIVPDGVISRETGKALPRLVTVDPLWVTMDHHPEDFDTVIRYTIRYTTTGPDGKEMARKEVIEIDFETGRGWIITQYQSNAMSGGRWVMMGEPVMWPWPFTPIVHWQNLPSADSVYGQPDITSDVIALQDRVNFVSSNISKIIRYHAHPQRIGRNVGSAAVIEMGADKMINLGPDGEIKNLEMQSDLASSQTFLQYLQRELFAITRTVDTDALTDKLGSLTNFGLRVIYQDALAKIATKRELYGDGLLTVNWMLLQLAGYSGAASDPGKIIWPEVLPVNESELQAGVQADMGMGIVSKETAAERRGYDWTQEQERMSAETQAAGNVGALLLRSFDRGR